MNGKSLYAEPHERLGIKTFCYCGDVQCRVVKCKRIENTFYQRQE